MYIWFNIVYLFCAHIFFNPFELNINEINTLHDTFQKNSVLKYTHELKKKKTIKFPF